MTTMTTDYFPVAGCGGVGSEDAADYDRRWLVVDQHGAWLSPGQHPDLHKIEVQLRFGYLVLRAPGMLRLDIPLDVLEDDDSVRTTAALGAQTLDVVDEGEMAAVWFSTYLQQPCRLMKLHPDQKPVSWPDA